MPKKRKLKSCFYAALILLWLPLFSQAPETETKDLEKRLSVAVGEERIKILVRLAEALRYQDPLKTLSYGKEALKELERYSNDHLKLPLLNLLGELSTNTGDLQALKKYSTQAEALAKRVGNKNEAARAAANLGVLYWIRDDFKQARKYFTRSRKLFLETGDKKGLARSYHLMAVFYWRINDYNRVLEFEFKAQEIYKEISDTTGMAEVKNFIGVTYMEMGENEKSLNCFQEALPHYIKIKSRRGISKLYNNMGIAYTNLKNWAKAEEYYRKALQMNRELGNKLSLSNVLNNLGELYFSMKKYPDALDYYFKALEIKKAVGLPSMAGDVQVNIGKVYRGMRQYDKALEWMKPGLAELEKYNVKDRLSEAYLELSILYQDQGNYRDALAWYKKHKEFNDIVVNESSRRKISEIQFGYEMDKKEKAIALLKKNEELQDVELARQNSIQNLLIIVSLLIFVLAFVMYRRYRFKLKLTRALRKEIDEHRRTSLELTESEELFRVLAEKSMVGIYIIQDDLFKYVNPGFVSIFGTPQEEVIGKPRASLVFPEDQARVVENLNRRLSGEEPSLSYEFRGIRQTGEIIFLESYGAVTHYQGRDAVLGTLIDITDRKKAESELLKGRKLEAVGILAGGIAHDFNNLLSIIMGNISMARTLSDDKNKKLNSMLENAEKASCQATDLAQKLITFSEGGWVLPQQVRLDALLKECLAIHHHMKAFVHTVFPSHLDAIYGDERQLSQVISNLLENADEGMTEPKELFVEAETVVLKKQNEWALNPGDYVKIIIRDNGKGIPPEHMDKIFDPYFTTKATVSRKGMGLGLAICYSIIKKHNGAITVHSEVGSGTTVTLHLPAYREMELD